jgi:hypothetical protein
MLIGVLIALRRALGWAAAHPTPRPAEAQHDRRGRVGPRHYLRPWRGVIEALNQLMSVMVQKRRSNRGCCSDFLSPAVYQSLHGTHERGRIETIGVGSVNRKMVLALSGKSAVYGAPGQRQET